MSIERYYVYHNLLIYKELCITIYLFIILYFDTVFNDKNKANFINVPNRNYEKKFVAEKVAKFARYISKICNQKLRTFNVARFHIKIA